MIYVTSGEVTSEFQLDGMYNSIALTTGLS